MLAASLIIAAPLLVGGAKLFAMFTDLSQPHPGCPVIPARFICQVSRGHTSHPRVRIKNITLPSILTAHKSEYLVHLIDSPYADRVPYRSKDGRSIYFSSTRNGSLALYRFDVQILNARLGSSPRLLPSSPDVCSPGGRAGDRERDSHRQELVQFGLR
jgi:hypothetical protein